MSSFRSRASDLFTRMEKTIESDLNNMFAEHSAHGRLGSGTTALRAIEIFKARMSEALLQLQSEIASQVEHRGRQWRKACADVSAAIDDAKVKTPDIFANALKHSRVTGSGKRVFDERLSEAFNELHTQLRDFADGWTAPNAKGWHERHPVLYALLMVLAGALLGSVATLLTGG